MRHRQLLSLSPRGQDPNGARAAAEEEYVRLGLGRTISPEVSHFGY